MEVVDFVELVLEVFIFFFEFAFGVFEFVFVVFDEFLEVYILL